jgi:YVTN family beta-propeller protein
MSTSQPTVGDALAGYVIETLVGRGGMGEVFRAHDVRLDRTVALKVLGPHLADSDRFRERFLRESTLAARLDHPNVIPIFEAGESDGTLYIAMRLVEGTDLRAILREEDTIEPARAIGLLAPVAGALDAAHAAGLVHRDVKPANILVASSPELDPSEHVYLSDFGLTVLSADPGDGGLFTGTADYAAPELVTRGAVDHRVDVYALGCVLFECLTGKPPYAGDSVMAVLWGHVNDPVPAASDRNPALPEAADQVLRKALAKEPKARYSSCRDLVADLRTALGVEGPAALRGRKHRRLGVLAAVAAVVAAAGVAAAVVLSRGHSSAPPPARAGKLVRIDPAGGGTAMPIPVGASPVAVAADRRAVWVASPGDGSLWRVNPATGVPTRVAAIGVPGDLGIARNTVYVTSEGPTTFSGSVTAYDAGSGVRLGGFQLLACSMTAGPEGVWVAGCPHVQRISESSPYHVVRDVAVPFASPHVTATDRQEIGKMATGGGFVYALGDAADRRLWRIDPRAGRIVQTYRLGFAPVDLAADAGSIWVVDQIGDAVVRIDRASGRQTARIPVGAGASGVALGAGSVWVSSFLDRSVSRIDPRTNTVTTTIPVGMSPRELAFGAGTVWAVGDAG